MGVSVTLILTASPNEIQPLFTHPPLPFPASSNHYSTFYMFLNFHAREKTLSTCFPVSGLFHLK